MAATMIIQDIIDVAKALFDLRDTLAKAQKKKRDQMADYFQAVSVCLAATYEALTANVVPYRRCAELSLYGDCLPKLVRGLLEDSKAWELTNLFTRSHLVEGLWEELNADPEKGKDLPAIAEASGIFLAVSNSVRLVSSLGVDCTDDLHRNLLAVIK